MAGGARYDSDPLHGATTFGADDEVTGVELLIAVAVSGLRSGIGRLRGQHMPATSDVVAAPAIGEEAVVADAMEAVRQAVQKKAADELIGAKRHCLGLAVMSIVLPGEADLAVGEPDQINLEGSDIFQVQTIGRPTKIPAELRYGGKVGSLVAGDRLRTVMSSIMRRRSGLISAIGEPPV